MGAAGTGQSRIGTTSGTLRHHRWAGEETGFLRDPDPGPEPFLVEGAPHADLYDRGDPVNAAVFRLARFLHRNV